MHLRKRLAPLLALSAAAAVIIIIIIDVLSYYLYGTRFEAVLRASRGGEDPVISFRLLHFGVLGLGTAIGFSLFFISMVLRKRWASYACVTPSSMVSLLTMFVLSHKIPIEMMYRSELAKYSHLVDCCKNGSLGCIWNFTRSVANEFGVTYEVSIVKP